MFNVERFIGLVEERPALYDPRVQEYSNRDVKSRCWWQIGSQVYDDWDAFSTREKCDKEKELMRKWKAIRDNFVKDIRHRKKLMNGEGIPKTRRYIYYSAMQFLLPIIDDSGSHERVATNGKRVDLRDLRNRARSRQSQLRVRGAAADQSTVPLDGGLVAPKEEDGVQMANSTVDDDADTVNANASLAPYPKSPSPGDRMKDIFGNRAFLLSYLPIMDDLPSDLALEARLKITEVFRNICAAGVTRRSVHSDHDLVLPEALVELVDSPSDNNVNLDLDLSD